MTKTPSFNVGQRVRHKVTGECATVVASVAAEDPTRVGVRYDGEDIAVWNTLARKLEPIEDEQ